MKSLAELMDDRVLEADINAAFDAHEGSQGACKEDAPGKNSGVFGTSSQRKPNIDDWIASASWNKKSVR